MTMNILITSLKLVLVVIFALSSEIHLKSLVVFWLVLAIQFGGFLAGFEKILVGKPGNNLGTLP